MTRVSLNKIKPTDLRIKRNTRTLASMKRRMSDRNTIFYITLIIY